MYLHGSDHGPWAHKGWHWSLELRRSLQSFFDLSQKSCECVSISTCKFCVMKLWWEKCTCSTLGYICTYDLPKLLMYIWFPPFFFFCKLFPLTCTKLWNEKIFTRKAVAIEKVQVAMGTPFAMALVTTVRWRCVKSWHCWCTTLAPTMYTLLFHLFGSGHVGFVPQLIGWSGGMRGNQQRSSSSSFCGRLLWAVLARAGTSTLLILSIQHFLCRPSDGGV